MALRSLRTEDLKMAAPAMDAATTEMLKSSGGDTKQVLIVPSCGLGGRLARDAHPVVPRSAKSFVAQG